MRKVPASGRFCPSCGNDIGWMPGMRALWPTSLACPHCDHDLKYLDIRNFKIVIILLIIAICVVAFYIAADMVPFIYALLRIGLTALFMVLLWIPVMVLSGVYLRANKALDLKDDGNKRR